MTRISYRVFFPPQSLSIVVDRPDKGSGYDRTIGTVHILRKHIFRFFGPPVPPIYNKRGGWNKRGGGAKVAKSLNVEGGIFWKKLVHNSNKRGVEVGKI